MNQVSTFSTLKGTVKRVPAVRAWIEERLHRRFLSPQGYASYFGVFDSFEDARRLLPPSREFASEDVIKDVNARAFRLYLHDYPAIHWLAEAFLQGATRVFDIGGSTGVHFHAYRRILSCPAEMAWQVCEVPAVVRVGREFAAAHGATGLSFVDVLDPADVRADIWLSSGALQYIEDGDMGALLDRCPAPPTHLILNKLPLYDGEPFVVTQNIGCGAFAAAHVYNRAHFVRQVEARGYELVDAWEVPERAFYLPLHPQRCFSSFSGLCFRALRTSLQ